MYGIEIEIVSDHRVFKKILKASKANKTFSSRSTRLMYRLLPFEFTVVPFLGRILGIEDYLSRHSSPSRVAVIKWEQMFNDWFTFTVVSEFTKDLDEVITVN